MHLLKAYVVPYKKRSNNLLGGLLRANFFR